jgi:hypothetical protein
MRGAVSKSDLIIQFNDLKKGMIPMKYFLKEREKIGNDGIVQRLLCQILKSSKCSWREVPLIHHHSLIVAQNFYSKCSVYNKSKIREYSIFNFQQVLMLSQYRTKPYNAKKLKYVSTLCPLSVSEFLTSINWT